MNNISSTRRLQGIASLLIAFAGLVHLVIGPWHWAHAPAHGLFFALVGIVEIAWAMWAWRQPSAMLYSIGLVMAGGLVVLWAITRVLPAPFGHGPEPVEVFGVVCKLSEVFGAVVLGLLAFQAMASTRGRSTAWRLVAILVIVALVGGWFTYGIARAAEPTLPWLGAPAEHHHEPEATPAPEHHHEHNLTPTPEYGSVPR